MLQLCTSNSNHTHTPTTVWSEGHAYRAVASLGGEVTPFRGVTP